jgi:hypothetical protein
MKTKKSLIIITSFLFVMFIISSLNLFMGTNKIYKNTIYFDKLQSSGTTYYNDRAWVNNSEFTEPVDPWYPNIIGDPSDATTSTSPNQANIKIIGDSHAEQILLNSATLSNWEAFNKSELVVVPQRVSVPTYGIDSEGCWCSHRWWEGETGGQPKNTPEMHWRTNVSLPVDMSDYIITSVDFEAVINASVDIYIDTPGDTLARAGVSINQAEKYDFVRFYVEVTTLDVDELNTYRIAFNQTRMLGNEGLSLYDIEGYIGAYEEQAIIDALTNVLIADPGHNNFTVVLGIYMYCEDNQSGTDLDDWTDLRFKTLNMTFSYVKKIDQFTGISWNQDLAAINGSNVRVNRADLRFKFKIDQNWTQASQNSQIRMYINDRKYEQTVSLIDYVYSPTFQDVGVYDIVSKILPYEVFTLSIQVYLAEDFGLEHNITISITDVNLNIWYTTYTDDIFSEPWVFAALLALVSVAAVFLGGYFIAYQRILKYPRPVRKVRKYRRTLNKGSPPTVAIIPREVAFKKSYNSELGVASKMLKLKHGEPKESKVETGKPKTPSEKKIDSDELIESSLEKKSELDEIVDKSIE